MFVDYCLRNTCQNDSICYIFYIAYQMQGNYHHEEINVFYHSVYMTRYAVEMLVDCK